MGLGDASARLQGGIGGAAMESEDKLRSMRGPEQRYQPQKGMSSLVGVDTGAGRPAPDLTHALIPCY